MLPIDIPVKELVPHAGAMSLLTRVLEGDEESLIAEVEIDRHSLFLFEGTVGAWVGVEYMAQAVAAWAGWRARLRGEPPRVGLLLGTRRLTSTVPAFAPGERLQIHVERTFQADSGVGQFDCSIRIAGATVAQAALTVLEPRDLDSLLKDKQDD